MTHQEPSSPARHSPLTHTPLILLVVVGVGLLASCQDRPLQLEEWREGWEDTVATVEVARTKQLTETRCNQLLVHLREQRPVLTPPPLDDLQSPVSAWFSEAEGAFFDCRFDEETRRRVYETLAALEAEVAAVLEVEG